MDNATIVGLLAAFGLIFMAISENAPAFVDTASLLIVVAGSIAVVMARCSLGEFLGAMGVMGKAFSRKSMTRSSSSLKSSSLPTSLERMG